MQETSRHIIHYLLVASLGYWGIITAYSTIADLEAE
jgi:hypothetical protein